MSDNPNGSSTNFERYPWYEIVEGDDLEQGDIFEACPVFAIVSPFSFEQYRIKGASAPFFDAVGFYARFGAYTRQASSFIATLSRAFGPSLCALLHARRLAG